MSEWINCWKASFLLFQPFLQVQQTHVRLGMCNSAANRDEKGEKWTKRAAGKMRASETERERETGQKQREQKEEEKEERG